AGIVLPCNEPSLGAQEDAPKPLPAEVHAAWVKADASVGWMANDRDGATFREGVEGKKGEVPAFRLWRWTGGAVGKLPQPQQAFGLDLSQLNVTDAGLKELVQFKNLQLLVLRETQVTDTGLKELAQLKNLQALSLYDTRVTGTALKDLAGITNLQTLD